MNSRAEDYVGHGTDVVHGVFDPGEQGQLQAAQGGTASTAIDPNLENQFTREALAYIEHELAPNFAVGATYTYRRTTNTPYVSYIGVNGTDWVPCEQASSNGFTAPCQDVGPTNAAALDAAGFGVRLSNRPFDLLVAMIGEGAWARVGGTHRNLMRLLFHPNGIQPLVANWRTIAPLLWHRARREADALGGQEMKAILAELAPYQDAETLWSAEDAALVPVLPLEMEKDGLRVSLFSVIATFGTAQDVTADELRIESFFPADEATARLFRQTDAEGP